MKDITTTPTADLIAEWGKKQADIEAFEIRCNTVDKFADCIHPDGWFLTTKARNEAIATELDMRATEAGIAIYENQFVYNTNEFWITHTRNLEHDIMTLAANGNITAKEQHDLETWLLIKNTP